MTYNDPGQSLQSSQLQLTFGSYDYNQTTQTFHANFPATSGMPETAVAATVTSNSLPGAFSYDLRAQFLPNVTATAQAVHRPRDIALVMDLSGSMRMGTCLGFDFYTTSRTSNNPDTLFPTFGHYSSSSADMQGPTTNQTSADDSYTISPSNTTAANSSYSLTYMNSFYQNAAYATTSGSCVRFVYQHGRREYLDRALSGSPLLPPASTPRCRAATCLCSSRVAPRPMPPTSRTWSAAPRRTPSWELDGYSAYSAGKLDTLGDGGVPKFGPEQTTRSTPFNGYTQGRAITARPSSSGRPTRATRHTRATPPDSKQFT